MRAYDRDVKSKFADRERVMVKKRLIIVLSFVIMAVIAVSTFAAVENSVQVAAKKPFYVGVTYCGDSVTEAEQLIDSVKNYTNLFVLQSGPLMWDPNASEQICDYAVKSELNVIICSDTNSLGPNLSAILNIAPTRWGSHFLGLYFNDEPGGHMLDGSVSLNTIINIDNNSTTGSIFKDGSGAVSFTEGLTQINVFPSGQINLDQMPTYFGGWGITDNQNQTTTATYPQPGALDPDNDTTYYVNGIITYLPYGALDTLTYEPNGTVLDQNGQSVTDAGNISRFIPYRQILNLDPLLNCTDTANEYANNLKSTLSHIGNQTNVNLFTSDYGLYWFDYLGGYNTVFGELFGQQIDEQTLALLRGAADMQGKSWGVMIEPACQTPLTLQTGNQMFNELRQTYEDGAEYAVVFNYAPNSNSSVGLLQDQQFAALQKFWVNVVQNPKTTNNVKGQDVLVLPAGYGWGMRSPTDTIWGIWRPDNSSQQVWNAVQASLAKYGSKLDIVYNEPTVGQYKNVYYWNQTI
jgi:hypothetical protein